MATQNQEGETFNGRLLYFFSSLLATIGGVFGHTHEEPEMAPKVAVAPQPQRRDGGKGKIAEAECRNRRALGDIGNLVTVRGAAEAKAPNQISRPITRSFNAQLLANAQEAAEKNKKKGAELVEGVGGAEKNKQKKGVEIVEGGRVVAQKEKKAPVQKKPSDKSNSVAAVASSSHKKEEDEKQGKNATGGKSKGGSTKKIVQRGFTSALAAGSKVACAISNTTEDLIVNIDAEDTDNELAEVEYVKEIYMFYKLSEDEYKLHDYMASQPEINEKMRSILVDWMIEVHHKFELVPETLYLTINIVDRFLCLKLVPRKELQLVGISSMLLACKYEEIWAPEVNDFVCISDKAYAREQVLVMEKAILGKLEWYLTVPTPYVFLIRYIKASIPDQELENMVFFLAELGLMHYTTMISYSSSIMAASAVYAARRTLNMTPPWSDTLRLHTGYSEDELMDCAKLLVGFHMAAEESKLKAVYRKYSNPARNAVALLPAAKSLLSAIS